MCSFEIYSKQKTIGLVFYAVQISYQTHGIYDDGVKFTAKLLDSMSYKIDAGVRIQL